MEADGAPDEGGAEGGPLPPVEEQNKINKFTKSIAILLHRVLCKLKPEIGV